MNVQQQKQGMSWSEFYFEVVGNAKGAQKQLIKTKANEIYEHYKSGKSPVDVLNHIIGGRL